MSHKNQVENKIYLSLAAFSEKRAEWKDSSHKIVFTNGCFDLIHEGHLDYLCKAADLGDKLIIGLNSDASVSLLKGSNRPILNERTRSLKLASFSFVDAVILFSEETPLSLIQTIEPTVLVKGGDYVIEDIVGSEETLERGGQVLTIPFLEGHSTSKIIDKIKSPS